MTEAERQAVNAAARRASKRESRPWRVGDLQGGPRLRRRRRAPRFMARPRAVAGLLALAAVGLVVYAAFFHSTSRAPLTLRLPNPGQILARAGPCRASAYPPGAQYTFERCVSGRSPVAWPRCSRVTYDVDATQAPAGFGSDIRYAVAALKAATGLQLEPVTRDADIRISWDPSLYNPVPGSSGEAGETDFRTTSGLSGVHATLATVRISSHLATGSSPGIGEVPVILHELGHAVGLAHHTGALVMNPLDRGFTRYQPGDLAGLAALYHPTNCPTG